MGTKMCVLALVFYGSFMLSVYQKRTPSSTCLRLAKDTAKDNNNQRWVAVWFWHR